MQFNFPSSSTEIRSKKTGKPYTFSRADQVDLSEESVAQVARVCDETEIYDNVFSAIFKGKRYSSDNARTFTKLVSGGWQSGGRFDWLILHAGEIVGTIGIKSLEGEIGYWQSNKHPGVMTLALRSLCGQARDAGMPSLWAYVKKTNAPSIRVLEGAGFELDPDLTAKREDAFGYRIKL
jgi:RimJ/RimL family protein N-acetyltransferase